MWSIGAAQMQQTHVKHMLQPRVFDASDIVCNVLGVRDKCSLHFLVILWRDDSLSGCEIGNVTAEINELPGVGIEFQLSWHRYQILLMTTIDSASLFFESHFW